MKMTDESRPRLIERRWRWHHVASAMRPLQASRGLGAGPGLALWWLGYRNSKFYARAFTACNAIPSPTSRRRFRSAKYLPVFVFGAKRRGQQQRRYARAPSRRGARIGEGKPPSMPGLFRYGMAEARVGASIRSIIHTVRIGRHVLQDRGRAAQPSDGGAASA